MKKGIYLLLGILWTVSNVHAQSARQNIRGIVVDKDSKMPLIGVTLVIENSNPLIGTTTDLDGNFIFKELTLGRYNIVVNYLGYEPRVVYNVQIGAGKEVVLKIALEESVVKLEEVSVLGKKDKSEAINTMSTVSARSFTVEETKRYAGGLNDPSRMAASYAGVAGDADGNNDIIIRGNSPKGLLWRLEGIEIPNPNHFSEEGASGGPIGILNGNVLSNSDFFTGAFPAEYGNAYSGVFDINFRDGNNRKREYSFLAGVVGLDASVEGPFVKGKEASYLVNYRYSTLGLLTNTGILDFGGIPEYQDLSFNFNFPTKKMGHFKLFGLGGISDIASKDSIMDNVFGVNMGVVGLAHTYRVSERTYIKTIVAATGSQNKWTLDYAEKDSIRRDFKKWAEENYTNTAIRANVCITSKLNAKNTIKTGFIYSILGYDLFSDYRDFETDKLVRLVEEDGNTQLYQAYVNWKLRITEDITLTSGLHSMCLALNGNYTIEPRLGAKWQFTQKQSLSLGFGIHSKMGTISGYYALDTNKVKINKGLDFSKARHYVFGYNHQLAKNLVLKSEIYYQDLYNIPVENDVNSGFSMLNYVDGYTTVELVNEGTGKNYGLELTVEKFFTNNYYYMMTGSLFNSKYKALDGIERNSRFNGNYVFNVLGGKDFKLRAKNCCRTLQLSIKGMIAGGAPYIEILEDESITAGYGVYDFENMYSKRRKDYYKIDLKAKLSREKKRSTRSWELEIQNVTNSKTTTGEYYDMEKEAVVSYSQLGILPVLSYRIEF